MDVEHLQFKRCDKSFKFGGDGESVSCWMVQLPAKLGDKVGRIQCFVIFGAAPMLLGRPILEILNAVVDFGGKRMCLLGGDWQEIRRGKGSAMLLKLADGVTQGSQLTEVQFDLISEDDDHDQVENLSTFLKDLHAENRYAQMTDVVREFMQSDATKPNMSDTACQANDDDFPEAVPLPDREKLENICNQQSAEVRNQVSGMVHMARDGARAKAPLFWEVYVGEGRLSTEVAKLGAHVERFGLNEGWDFSLSTHRREFLQKIDSDESDEIFMSPKCTLWSRMQDINIKCAADAADLEERREIDHGTHLFMCRKAYWKQVRAGRHAHIEHPEKSRAWQTKAFSTLPGYAALLDQCEYGATTINDGFSEPIKKSTRTQTTKNAMFNLMNRRCQGDHTHCPLIEGSMPGGGHRSRSRKLRCEFGKVSGQSGRVRRGSHSANLCGGEC